jgi:hypothetical protein
MTQGEKVDELQRNMATMTERVDTVLKVVDALQDTATELLRDLANVRREHEKEIALLKRDVEELKKWKEDQKKERDEWNRRLWAFGPNVLGAFISGINAAIVAYFISRQ